MPGVFYPKKQFWFENVDEGFPISISFVPGPGMNSFKKCFLGTTFTDRRYKVVRIKKISYEWEDNIGNFLKKNEYYRFRLTGYKTDLKDGWYIGYTPDFSGFNPEKLFKGKKIGDVFKFYLNVVYSFDDEPENIQILEYNVNVTKGEYRSFWSGIYF
jgi:hypothetical protein